MISEKLEIIYHQHSNQIAKWLVSNIKKNSIVIDWGCGHGFYVYAMRHFGIDAFGLDRTENFNIHCKVEDITRRIPYIGIDYSLCLEVGEHIPKEKESGLLDNICQAKKGVILSWAKIGQEGIDHINCKSPEDVIAEMDKRGFKVNESKTIELQQANINSHCSWLTENIRYYEPQ